VRDRARLLLMIGLAGAIALDCSTAAKKSDAPPAGNRPAPEPVAPAGEPCGRTTCPPPQFCCNPSCGICAPPGGFCTQQFCTDPGAATPAGRPCKDHGDCRAFSDYCTGCDCRPLHKNDETPTCAGPRVRCFADPCLKKVAACSSGRCVLRDGSAY
jgi:hypothetical protein